MLAHLSGTICLKHSATLILPPLSKLPSKRTCLIIILKLLFTALPIPSSDTVCVCACVRAFGVIVKRPVLPPSVVDGRSRNPLYYYYFSMCNGLCQHISPCLAAPSPHTLTVEGLPFDLHMSNVKTALSPNLYPCFIKFNQSHPTPTPPPNSPTPSVSFLVSLSPLSKSVQPTLKCMM